MQFGYIGDRSQYSDHLLKGILLWLARQEDTRGDEDPVKHWLEEARMNDRFTLDHEPVNVLYRLLEEHLKTLVEKEKRDEAFMTLADPESAVREGTDILVDIAKSDRNNNARYGDLDCHRNPGSVYRDAMETVEKTRECYETWLNEVINHHPVTGRFIKPMTRAQYMAGDEPVEVDEVAYVHTKGHFDEMEGLLEALQVSRKHREAPFEDGDSPKDLFLHFEDDAMPTRKRDASGRVETDDTWFTDPRVIIRGVKRDWVSKKGKACTMVYEKVQHDGKMVWMSDWGEDIIDSRGLTPPIVDLLDDWAWKKRIKGITLKEVGKSRLKRLFQPDGKTRTRAWCNSSVHKGDNWVVRDTWDRSSYQETILAESIWRLKGGKKDAALQAAREHLARFPNPIRGKTGNWRCAGCGGFVVDRSVYLEVVMHGWLIEGKWVFGSPDHERIQTWTVQVEAFGRMWRQIREMEPGEPKVKHSRKNLTKKEAMALRNSRFLVTQEQGLLREKRRKVLKALDRKLELNVSRFWNKGARKWLQQADCHCVQCGGWCTYINRQVRSDW